MFADSWAIVKYWLFFCLLILLLLSLEICRLRTLCLLCSSRSLSCYNLSLLTASKTVGSVLSALLWKEAEPDERLNMVL